MDFGEGRFVIGRKLHRCAGCHGPIPKGESHYHQTGMWGGEWQNWRAHKECHDIWAANVDYYDDGYFPDDLDVPERLVK